MLDELAKDLNFFLDAFEKEKDAAQRAWLYLRCAERAVPLQLEGREVPALPELTRALLRGLETVLSEPPASIREKFRARRIALEAMVSDADTPEDIPEEAIDEICLAYRASLDHSYWLIHFESLAPPAPRTLLETIHARGHDLELEVVQLPKPPQVAERLTALSATLHLEGNPLFPWWLCFTDMHYVLGEVGNKPFKKLGSTQENDWIKAPSRYRERVHLALQCHLAVFLDPLMFLYGPNQPLPTTLTTTKGGDPKYRADIDFSVTGGTGLSPHTRVSKRAESGLVKDRMSCKKHRDGKR